MQGQATSSFQILRRQWLWFIKRGSGSRRGLCSLMLRIISRILRIRLSRRNSINWTNRSLGRKKRRGRKRRGRKRRRRKRRRRKRRRRKRRRRKRRRRKRRRRKRRRRRRKRSKGNQRNNPKHSLICNNNRRLSKRPVNHLLPLGNGTSSLKNNSQQKAVSVSG